MYIKIFLKLIFGYINIQIEGYFIEKFFNICISKGIFLWNIRRTKSTIAYANIGLNDFKNICKIAKDNKCRVKIVKKKGIPFLSHRYKKRKSFLICFLLLIVIVISLSNFIWNIDVIGNNKISKEEIIKILETKGLNIGCFKYNINTKELVNNIRLERNDLAWIGIEIKGTNAIIKVVEADKKPDIIDEEDYCNIVATKPGIIVKVNAMNRHTPSKRR